MARTKSFNEQETLVKILMLFGQKGFHQSSLDDILKAAGISKQSVYDTYGDKRTLFIKAFTLYREHMTGAMKARVESEISAGKPYLEILRGLLCQEGSADEQVKGCFMVNSMVEFRDENAKIQSEIRAEIDNLLSFMLNTMESIVQGGQSVGEITPDIPASQIAAIMMNARNGLQVGKDYDMPPQQLGNVADWTIDLIRAKN
jgi:TetR/AcrR family transcriptional repressor of nem operon